MSDIFDSTNHILGIDDSEDSIEIQRMYAIEKAKWHFVANDTNMSANIKKLLMTYNKFYEFIYSEEFIEVRVFESNVTFAVYDVDKNGFISIREFLELVKCNKCFSWAYNLVFVCLKFILC